MAHSSRRIGVATCPAQAYAGPEAIGLGSLGGEALFRQRCVSWAVILLLVGVQAAAFAADAQRLIAVAWNDSKSQEGRVQRFITVAPWSLVGGELPVGLQSSLRFSGDRLYAVSLLEGNITAIDVPLWNVAETYIVGANSEPIDIAVVSGSLAYVSTRTSTQLLALDLVSGATSSALDLTAFDHPAGNFMAGTMALDGNRLVVQLARFEPDADLPAAAPLGPGGYLVLVDITTGQIVDVNTDKPGVQAIELAGTFPKYRMAVLRDTRRLLVSASGGFFDEGGLEVINLDSHTSLGLVIEEADGHTGADLLSFVMTREDGGYLTSSTDLLPSSHLARFSLQGGALAEELFVSVDYHVPSMIFDPRSNSLFVPDGGFQNAVWAFDAASGSKLNGDDPARVLDGPPSDLELLCDPLEEFDCLLAHGEIPVFENGFEDDSP
jgi:hypothetical protein